MIKLPDGTLKLLVEGIRRSEIIAFREEAEHGYSNVKIRIIEDTMDQSPEMEALKREVASQFEEYVKINRKLPTEMSSIMTNIEDASRLADTIASHLTIKLSEGRCCSSCTK